MAGPVADIGVSGSAEYEEPGFNADYDGKFRNIGLTTGIIGYF